MYENLLAKFVVAMISRNSIFAQTGTVCIRNALVDQIAVFWMRRRLTFVCLGFIELLLTAGLLI